MANYRGVPRAEYLSRTLAKVQTFEIVSDYLVGTRQKYDDMVTDAATAELVAAILPLFTLPA